MKVGYDPEADYYKKEQKNPWGEKVQAIWKGQQKFPDPEETRRNRLITGTNWPPRTYPKPGEGYFFFQGPTPKTAYQADLPSFFSAENFASIEIKPVQIYVTITAVLSVFALFAVLNGSPSESAAPAKAPAGVSFSLPSLKADPAKAAAEEAKKEAAAAEKAAAKAAPKAEKAAPKPKAEKAAPNADKAAAEKAAAEKVATEKAEKAAAEKA